jgi:hypothetical protein
VKEASISHRLTARPYHVEALVAEVSEGEKVTNADLRKTESICGVILEFYNRITRRRHCMEHDIVVKTFQKTKTKKMLYFHQPETSNAPSPLYSHILTDIDPILLLYPVVSDHLDYRN